MKKFSHPIRRLLSTAQHRFVRSRPGSVLILVVALLVLMALIGTAYMSMAQSDRASAAQHTSNTEIDLLLEGVINLVKGTTVSELFANGQFRPGSTYTYPIPTTASPYNHVTGLGVDPATAAFEQSLAGPNVTSNAGTTWLSPRIPEIANDAVPPTLLPDTSNAPVWRFLTSPIAGAQYESPFSPTGTPNTYGRTVPIGYLGAGLNASFAPTSVTLNGTLYPALQELDWNSPPRVIGTYLAADADGDGIADSGLFRLPIGAIGGVTYYAAVRIVDNGGAVNANVAWQPNPTVGTPAPPRPQLPGDFFPSNIDLLDMLVQQDAANGAMGQLTAYHFGPQNPLTVVPTDDRGNVRPDFTFISPFDALWTQLDRRLNNPVPGYLSLPTSDSVLLARNFIIRDVSVTQPKDSSALLERLLPYSLFGAARTLPYQPSDATTWFGQNFAFYNDLLTGVNTQPLRSVLVGQNTVSNFAPSKFRDRGPVTSLAAAAPYQFGDMITWNGHRYICINPLQATTVQPAPMRLTGPGDPTTTYDNDTWVYEPWTTSPTKIPVNSATFGQLWLAYWSVMADQTRSDGNLGPAFPYGWDPTLDLLPLNRRSGHMFRSPLRVAPPTTGGSRPWLLTPMQVMQLRAAIAAVNAIDMRDSDDDVTSRTVQLIDPLQANPRLQQVFATVYGLEKQPFITQVYATNESPATTGGGGGPGGGTGGSGGGGAGPTYGFVAVELYNPGPTPLTLTNWVLASTPRTDTPPPFPAPPGPLTNPNLTFTILNQPWDNTTASPPVIPAGGYIVLASNPTPPTGVSLPSTLVLTPQTPGTPPVALTAGQARLYVVPNLIQALNNELYLMRPRRANGSLTKSFGAPAPTAAPTPFPLAGGGGQMPFQPYAAFNEGPTATPHAADMVPVDSYDFTGLSMGATGETPTEWYYVRPSLSTAVPGPTNKTWHYVYPGHYNFATNPLVPGGEPFPAGTTTKAPRLIDGTVYITPGLGNSLINALNNTTRAPTIPMGMPQASAALLAYKDITLQLNNTDFAGPNGPTSPRNAFPFGGFARNGDMLEVPFIGSYRLAVQSGPATVTGIPLQTIEMNPVTMDSVMALGLAQPEWGEAPTYDEGGVGFTGGAPSTPLASSNANGGDPIVDSTIQIENVGRFSPISALDFAAYSANPGTVALPPYDDYAPAPLIPAGTPSTEWLYHWATRLFDYLTVQSPQQDYLPDVDPAYSDPDYYTTGAGAPRLPKYFPPGLPALPAPIANDSPGTANAEPTNPAGGTEETVPLQGLVNINTAPWRVLAAVPWLPYDYPAYDGASHYPARMAAQTQIAMSIVRYRDLDGGTGKTHTPPHGPFKTLFELNDVPIYTLPGAGLPTFTGTYFRDFMGVASATHFTFDQGNLSPAYSGTDNIFGDFKSKYMMINRVSNLLTTRSDSYTAYILIQGWLQAETPNPTLVVQRRAAILIDRSSVTSTNRTPTVTNIPAAN